MQGLGKVGRRLLLPLANRTIPLYRAASNQATGDRVMVTARDLSRMSAERIKAHDRDGWIALFADDAVVQDPVGPSMFDPEGKGHHGKAGVTHFYDTAIAPNKDVTFEVHQSHLCGDEVANVVTLHITQASGTQFALPCVICYKAAPDGKIASLRAFWETGNIPGF
jgi:steroid Delta-isomerase